MLAVWGGPQLKTVGGVTNLGRLVRWGAPPPQETSRSTAVVKPPVPTIRLAIVTAPSARCSVE